MLEKFKKGLNGLLCAVLIFQLTGCGTILYPERRGQKAGHLDVGVVLLDGIGLLFFLIPGIIAYAVDFSNGTIYLPAGSASLDDPKNIREVKFDPKNTTKEELEAILSKETGREVKFDRADLQITELNSLDEMMGSFAIAQNEMSGNRLSLLVKP